jgi:hypothetical protein
VFDLNKCLAKIMIENASKKIIISVCLKLWLKLLLHIKLVKKPINLYINLHVNNAFFVKNTKNINAINYIVVIYMVVI